MNKYIGTALLCAGAIAIGCGGQYQDTATDEWSSDLGQTEQPLAANGPNYGISTAASHIVCDKVNSGQSCVVPKSLQLTYCYTGFTAAQQSRFDSDFGNFNSENAQHFSFGRALISTADCLAGVAGSGAIKVRPGTGNCSGGGTSGTIDSYVCFVPGGLTALTESVPGTWQRWAGGDIFVDSSDLITQDGTVSGCVGDHGIRHAAAAAAGLGANNPSCANDLGACMTDRSITPKTFNGTCVHAQLSNQEKCEASSYTLNPQTSWSFNASNCQP
jgi:hypothetical protein